VKVPERTIRWVERVTDARVVRTRSLRRGPIDIRAVTLESSRGNTSSAVLRMFVDREALESDTSFRPENELHVLGVLEATPVPAPALIAEDVEARACHVPTLLTTLIPGRNGFKAVPRDLAPWLRQMAEAAALIHEVPDPGGLRGFEPYEPGERTLPGGSSRQDLWRRVFDVVSGSAPPSEVRFIHRDYHQENTMWLRGRLTGVIDWTQACLGPLDIDLARMRLNLAREVSMEAAERFLQAYRDSIGDPSYEPDPYWELIDFADTTLAGLESGRDTDRFETLVASVLAKIV
jgi:aminoglycoside phosphotransferase (APT) family kinase protein